MLNSMFASKGVEEEHRNIVYRCRSAGGGRIEGWLRKNDKNLRARPSPRDDAIWIASTP
jgi:hypothetical protein